MEVDGVEEVEQVEVPADSEPAASDDEEEYEIELILDARKGAFPQVTSLGALSGASLLLTRTLGEDRLFRQVEGLWRGREQLGR